MLTKMEINEIYKEIHRKLELIKNSNNFSLNEEQRGFLESFHVVLEEFFDSKEPRDIVYNLLHLREGHVEKPINELFANTQNVNPEELKTQGYLTLSYFFQARQYLKNKNNNTFTELLDLCETYIKQSIGCAFQQLHASQDILKEHFEKQDIHITLKSSKEFLPNLDNNLRAKYEKKIAAYCCSDL